MEPAVILFDGVCNLCNASVNFIIDRDPKGYFRFAAIQSTQGQALLLRHGRTELGAALSTIVVIEDGRLYEESAGALVIARHLPGLWKLLVVFRALPRPLRDGLYRWVAANRYRWFGKTESCRIPTPELRARFLS